MVHREISASPDERGEGEGGGKEEGSRKSGELIRSWPTRNFFVAQGTPPLPPIPRATCCGYTTSM